MTHMFRFDGLTSPPTPGELIQQKLLDEQNLSQAELSRLLGISRPRLNMMLKGRCQMTAEIALRIERVFGILPQFWLRARYELELFEERQRIGRTLDYLPQLSSHQEPRQSAWMVSEWQAAA